MGGNPPKPHEADYNSQTGCAPASHRTCCPDLRPRPRRGGVPSLDPGQAYGTSSPNNITAEAAWCDFQCQSHEAVQFPWGAFSGTLALGTQPSCSKGARAPGRRPAGGD